MLYCTLSGRYLVEAEFTSLDGKTLDKKAKQSRNTLYKVVGGFAFLKLWGQDIGRSAYNKLIAPFVKPIDALIPDLGNVFADVAKDENIQNITARRQQFEQRLKNVVNRLARAITNKYVLIGAVLVVAGLMILALVKAGINTNLSQATNSTQTPNKKKLVQIAILIKGDFRQLFQSKAGRIGILLFAVGLILIAIGMNPKKANYPVPS